MRKLMAMGLLAGTAMAAPIGSDSQAAILTGDEVGVTLYGVDGPLLLPVGSGTGTVDGINTVGTIGGTEVSFANETSSPAFITFYFDFYEQNDMLFFEIETDMGGSSVTGTPSWEVRITDLDFLMGYSLTGTGFMQLTSDFGTSPSSSIESGGSELRITFDDGDFSPDTATGNQGVIVSGMFDVAQTTAIPVPAPFLLLLSGVAVIAGVRRFA